MGSSSHAFAAGERAALADLLGDLGPDAPTCCAGWTTAHLAAHLVVRDSRPDALPGLGVELVGGGGPLPRWAHGLEDRLRTSTPYSTVVERVRSGPPVPTGIPRVPRPARCGLPSRAVPRHAVTHLPLDPATQGEELP